MKEKISFFWGDRCFNELDACSWYLASHGAMLNIFESAVHAAVSIHNLIETQ